MAQTLDFQSWNFVNVQLAPAKLRLNTGSSPAPPVPPPPAVTGITIAAADPTNPPGATEQVWINKTNGTIWYADGAVWVLFG